MFVLLATLALLALFAVIGFFKGGLRMAVGYLGLVLALIFTAPLSEHMIPLAEKMKVVNPIAKIAVAGLLVFVLFNLVFIIVGAVLHFFYVKRLRLRRNEDQLQAWHRLNRNVGSFLGALTGATYVLTLGLIVYSLGNVTSGFARPGQDPKYLQVLNRARVDLKSSGLEWAVAGFDSIPADFYKTVDLLALIHHNPELRPRLALYPKFLEGSAAEAQMVDMASWRSLWESGASFGEFVNREDFPLFVIAMMYWTENIDHADLETFLRTGESKLSKSEKIVGRWKVDASAVMNQIKRSNPNLSIQELVKHKVLAATILAGVHITATPDNKILVSTIQTDAMKRIAQRRARKIQEIAEQSQVDAGDLEASGQPPQQNDYDQRMRDRYGPGYGGGVQPQQRQRQSQPARRERESRRDEIEFNFSGNGRWRRSDKESLVGTPYDLELSSGPGGRISMEAEHRIDRNQNDRLFVYTQGLTLVLNKIVH